MQVPSTEPWIVWLGRSGRSEPDLALLGGKAANLDSLAAAGLPVPPAFCLTTRGYRRFLDYNGLAVECEPAELVAAFTTAPWPPEMQDAVLTSAEMLSRQQPLLAVRSSATVEDLASASFAGQGDSALGVRGDTELLAAIRRTWASMWSARATQYLSTAGSRPPEMAILVQQMVPAELAGIAFSMDPLDGTAAVVVEAVTGLGDKLASGEVDGARYRVERTAGVGRRPLPGESLLSQRQLEQVVELALAAEEQLGAPQDIEWGFWRGDISLFQSRPISAQSTGFFTDHLPGDDSLWTGGFFNERFPRPVSPLGWTLLRELIEPLALADPLRFLGMRPEQLDPLVKLYRGHPYANVTAFQHLYAVFTERMLPADAYRFFPQGDVSLRKAVTYPRSIWAPRTFLSLAWTFVRHLGEASPWHNANSWRRFERRHAVELAAMERELHAAKAAARRPVETLWQLLQRAQSLNRRLLSLHRWSLVLADLTYTALQRLLAAWGHDADSTAARLCAGLPNYSLALNAALRQVAAGECSREDFLSRYGHRSYDLDITHPTFADRPAQTDELVRQMGNGAGESGADLESRGRQRRELESQVVKSLVFWQRPLFRHVLRLAQGYMQLRENQRFVWQKTLAFQRQVFLLLGAEWLDGPEEIFGATLEEVEAAALYGRPLPEKLLAARCAELHKLEAEHRQAPHLTYPAFLKGNMPLPSPDVPPTRVLNGLPVSPGLGRGPARVVLSADQLDRLQPGDVLVTRGADPGWTPLFGILAGLVLETGGQLSHGAVVAREYGLPAVAALPGITARLQDGQMVTVDGRTGRLILD